MPDNPTDIEKAIPGGEEDRLLGLLGTLVAKVTRMRTSQKAYFARHQDTDKKLSMGYETDVDNYVKSLRRHGINPPELPHDTKPNQGSIF